MKKQIDKCLEETCKQGLSQGVFGAVAASVSIHSQGDWNRYCWYAGQTRMDQAGFSVKPETLFDLASLTKPLSTTLCVASLMSEQRLGWDDRLVDIFPDKNLGGKENILLRQLLHHSSGLPGYRPYYKEYPSCWNKTYKRILTERIIHEPLLSQPGVECQYSDLGFIFLGNIIEQTAGIPMERIYRQWILGPAGLRCEDIDFRPLDQHGPGLNMNIAATENCPWRKRIIQGEVHDEHCWLMGGVAGHAGLFGTLRGVAGLCELLMNIWKKRKKLIKLDQNLLRMFLEYKQEGLSSRALGFDRPTPGASSSGKYFSSSSVGHLGFSGVSFWMDPEQDIIIVLLTNRIHPTRANEKIRLYRPWFHDQIMLAYKNEAGSKK